MFSAAHAARDDLAGGDANVSRQCFAEWRADLGYRLLDRGRGTHGTRRLVTARDRRAEDRHHGVADVLVDAPAEAIDDAVDGAEIALEQRVHVFGIEAFGEPRVATEIGEQHGDRPALGVVAGNRCGRGSRGRDQRAAAAAAEALAGLVRESARRARDREHGAAPRAEAPPRTVVRAAARAGDSGIACDRWPPANRRRTYPLTLTRPPSGSTNSASVMPCSGSGARVKRTPAAQSVA